MSFSPEQFDYLEPTKPLGGKERAAKIVEQIPLHPEDALKLYHELAFCCFPGVDHPLCEKACDYLLEHGDEQMVFNACWLKSDLALMDDKRVPEAIKLLKKCEEIEPDHESLHSRLGEAYARAYQYGEAIKHFLRHIEVNDHGEEDDILEDDYAQLAQAYFGNQDYDNAGKYFDLALMQNPEHVESICGMGRVRAQQEKYDDAMSYFKYAQELDPEDAYTEYYMGVVYASQEDFYRAMHHYTEALKLKPDFAEVYNNIGALYNNQEGDLKTALENMMKALEALEGKDDKFLSVVYLNVSKLYARIAEYDLAEHYKGLFFESMGFDVDWEEGDEDGESDDDRPVA